MKKTTFFLICVSTVNTLFAQKWTTYPNVQDDIMTMAIDQLGNKWLGTSNGVSVLTGSQRTYYTTNNGLAFNYVDAITIDKMGNKWFWNK